MSIDWKVAGGSLLEMLELLAWAMVTWLYTYIKIHQAGYVRLLRFAHFIICSLHLIKE